MTDQEVLQAIRRRLTGIEHEMLADPPVTAAQFAVGMVEVTREMLRTYAENAVPTDVLAEVLKTLLAPRPASARSRS